MWGTALEQLHLRKKDYSYLFDNKSLVRNLQDIIGPDDMKNEKDRE